MGIKSLASQHNKHVTLKNNTEVASSGSVYTQLDMLQDWSSMCTIINTIKNYLTQLVLLIRTDKKL
jgi:hypothetical protein